MDLLADTSKRIYMKRLALQICTNFLGRTISQSEFRIKEGKEYIRDELYYRLNVRPNKNMTASHFWQTVVYKLIHDNECLIIQSDDEDLLIADDFVHNQRAVYEDSFTNVVVNDFEFKRAFPMNKVFYLKYHNEELQPLIDSMYDDYGELFGRILNGQKRKNQIRGTAKLDTNQSMTKENMERLQNFINKMYTAFEEKDIAIVPEQKGFNYEEKNSSSNGQSVDEVNKVTNGFLDKLAMAIGIPPGLLHGEMADVEKLTKNYMVFCVNPFIKNIKDEGNYKFIKKKDYLEKNKRIDIRRVSYQSIFDLATQVDKLRSSGVMNGQELRDELNLERVDDPIMEEYVITKNYARSSESTEGGEE
ncbi:phage portal protein [Radiobacillus kanasensis]|nr:phage portal protein [Radiobacillus kanasensis]UFU01330.1 phage portal protein [Radiobacillus kanasensis]